MRTWLAIAIAGAVGVLVRHGVQQVVPRHGEIPWGTLIVNISGAFVLGLAFTIIVHRYSVPMWLQEAALIGFLGGYTTFSALALETFLLIDRGRLWVATAYSIGSVATGVLALFAGVRLGRLS